MIIVENDLDRVRARFGESLGYPAIDNFFISLDWFEVLAKYGLPPEHRPRVYIATDDLGVAQGALCCCESSDGKLSSLTTYYTIEYGVTLAASSTDPRSIIRMLVQFIAQERPRWTSLELRYLQANDETTSILTEELAAHSFSSHRFHQYENWYASTAGIGFDSYYAGRPSQMRNTIRRKLKKAQQAHALAVRILTRPSPELEAAIAGYTKVYLSSWKNPEPFPHFMPNLIRRAADLGVLRLGEITVDGEAAASQVWFTTPTRAMIYKLAYDEAFKELSAGSILSARLFEQALDEDHVAEIDYGVGSEPYKKDWMNLMRPIEGLIAHNSATISGRIADAAERAKRLVRGAS